MEGAPEHTRDPIFFYVQGLRNGDTTSMSMDSRCTVHDLCVKLNERYGVDPNRMSILIRGQICEPNMTLELTNLYKHDVVRMIVRDGATFEHPDYEEDDSPPDEMPLSHGRAILGEEVPRCTVIVEFLAPYMDTQMVSVVHGDMEMRVSELYRIVSDRTALMTEKMWFYKGNKVLDPTETFREAEFDPLTRVIVRTKPKAGTYNDGLRMETGSPSRTSNGGPMMETGSPSREPYSPDYSNDEEDA